MVKGNAEWHCAKQPNGAVTFKPKPMASGEEPLKSPTYWASLICITDYGNGAKVFNFNKEWVGCLCRAERFYVINVCPQPMEWRH